MKSDSRTSLKDVAERCGVSYATVSHILSGKPHYKFKKETVELVLKVAREMNYRPNAYASALRNQENRLILCVVGDCCRHSDVEHLKLLEYELGKRNYNLLIQFLVDLPEKMKIDFLERMINMPAGIAIWSLGVREEENLKRFCKLFDNAPPSLSLSIPFPGSKIDYIKIRWGGASCAKAAEFFASRGYKRVCCCCTSVEKRIAGAFIETAGKYDMHASVHAIPGGNRNYFEGALPAVKTILSAPELPQAIYCTSDEMAFVVIEEFRAAGIRVPEDVFILGGGDSAFAGYFHKPLPILVHDASLLCRTAADFLVSKIENGENCTGTGRCVAEIDCAIREGNKDNFKIVFPINSKKGEMQ